MKNQDNIIFTLNNFRNITKAKMNHIIVGDFNINIWKINTESKKLLNSFQGKGFYPAFIDITRSASVEESNTCIDNIFIKSFNIHTKTSKITTPFADHFALFADVKNQPKLNIKKDFIIIITNYYLLLLLNSTRISVNKCKNQMKLWIVY